MFRFPWYFTLTIRQFCNFTLRNISKKKTKKNENIFLTYMSISHSLSPRLALVDIHISSSCSCRMSSVAHTHTHTVVTIYVYCTPPKIVNSPVRSVIVYCILRCSRYFALLLRSLCSFFSPLSLSQVVNTTDGQRRLCTCCPSNHWNILTM